MSQNSYATVTSVTLDPPCGPPGTEVILNVKFTQGSRVWAVYSPELDVGGDMGETGFSDYFTVPEGVNLITITIIENDVPVKVITFTSCGVVGGVVAPPKKLEIITPYMALVGLVIAVSAIVFVKKKNLSL